MSDTGPGRDKMRRSPYIEDKHKVILVDSEQPVHFCVYGQLIISQNVNCHIKIFWRNRRGVEDKPMQVALWLSRIDLQGKYLGSNKHICMKF